MIIFRYLAREVFNTFSVISGILLLIVLTNQFARYLSLTAAGKLMGMQLLHLIILEIPQLLSLIFPLAFYLSVLLSYGRLYVDNEMVIFSACGLSQKRLLGMTLILSSFVFIPVLLFTLWLNPIFANTRNELLGQIKTTSMLQALLPGRFQQTGDGKQIFYVESMSDDRQQLKNIFVASQVQGNNPAVSDTWTVMSAEGGHRFQDPNTKDQFVVADNGYRYEGSPGTKDFTIYHFDQYGVRVNTPGPYLGDKIDSTPTWQLLKQSITHKKEDLSLKRESAAELQWRISLPLATFMLAIIAFSLSRVAPRHGRFAKLFPAVLLYMIYANFMIVGQHWIIDGTLPPLFGLWALHIIMLFIGSLLYIHQAGVLRVWQSAWRKS